MAAEALAAEAVASRLARQEEDIRWLWAEVHRLRDEQLNAPDRCQAEGPCLTREVAQLRAENRELRHCLHRLRLCLEEELSHQARLEGAERSGAGRGAAGAQVRRRGLTAGRGGAGSVRCWPGVGGAAGAGALRANGRQEGAETGPPPRPPHDPSRTRSPPQARHPRAAAFAAIARLT